jgi:hypothetical protein
VLKISAFAVALPKSFSIKVAYPIAKAKIRIKILINFMEVKKLKSLFIISENYGAKLLIIIKFVSHYFR